MALVLRLQGHPVQLVFVQLNQMICLMHLEIENWLNRLPDYYRL
jgi:hypothetical protein